MPEAARTTGEQNSADFPIPSKDRFGALAPFDKQQARVGFPADFSHRRCLKRTSCSLMVVRRGDHPDADDPPPLGRTNPSVAARGASVAGSPLHWCRQTDRLFGEDCDSSLARDAWRIPSLRSTGRLCGDSVANLK
jgi:hypothetical protein